MKDGNLIRSSSVSRSSALAKYWLKKGGLTDFDLFDILTKKYKFNLLEFGNWSNQKQRTDILIDLCVGLENVFNPLFLRTNNFGLDHNINFAFGSRGVKGALAHFEPNTMFISIKKYRNKSAGVLSDTSSFAHEYFHALDYFVGRFVEPITLVNYLSDSWDKPVSEKYPIRKQMSKLMLTYYQAQEKHNPDFLKVSSKRSYWASAVECFARLSEQCVAYYAERIVQFNRERNYLTKSLEHYYKQPQVYMTQKVLTTVYPIWIDLVIMLSKVMKGQSVKQAKQATLYSQVPIEKTKKDVVLKFQEEKLNGFRFQKNMNYKLRFVGQLKHWELIPDEVHRGIGKTPMIVFKVNNSEIGKDIVKYLQDKYANGNRTISCNGKNYGF